MSFLLRHALLDESSSSDDDIIIAAAAIVAQDEYEQPNARHRRRGGSIPGRQVVRRNRRAGYERLQHDYFSPNPTYGPVLFRRRFRMSRHLFLRIVNDVVAHDDYFVQKRNAASTMGISPLVKITAALRMITNGVAADTQDEYLQIADSTTIESLKRFVTAIVEIFGDEYLRYLTSADTSRLLALGEQRGFPGMLGSINCMHWEWKNCPSAWQGMYKGKSSKPTIVLEAIASRDLWIWHAFFGLPGSHNDINVLHRSPLFARLAEGQAPHVNYEINGHNYTMGYYLADRIYPLWATFVKTISEPQGNKKKHFAQQQEAARKDVERAFGVLQARFAIVRGPTRFWYADTLNEIMTACIILHNMIIEDERDDEGLDYNYDDEGERVTPLHTLIAELHDFIQNHHNIRNRQTHSQLQEDLVEHLWQFHGRN